MNSEVRRWIEKDGVEFFKEIGVKKSWTILDFGCREGHYTIPVAKRVGKNGKVYALDKDSGVLDKLKATVRQYNIKNIEFINEDTKIPLNDNTVDLILCYDVIHYEDKRHRRAIYMEVYRVLKEKGFFSVYPKHYKNDYPSDELADVELEDIIKEIVESGFSLEHKLSKGLLHDDNLNQGYILNFRRC